MDRGSKFMAEVKDMLRDDYGVTRKPITTRNPQANSIVERAHKTLDYLLKSQEMWKKNKEELEDAIPGILGAVAFGMRATVHTTTRATPAQLVFGRDAIHNINFMADWHYIKQRKQQLIVQNNNRENKRRREHKYSPGDKVMIKQDNNRKHEDALYQGPFTVTRVYDNGTVDLQQQTLRGGVLTQRWNIRNLHPCRD
jgi:cobalamin-dependent methionine synthase I